MGEMERHEFDVVVIGAGGAGLRAAIEARQQGKRTAIISKSLFGKAHTVMAEGGCAAAMGNVNPKDNWQVHFRDTMRGGKFLNNWRMAELHAQEAPDRVWELETYGALFDRTPEGKISQRNFGGHTYPRLAHVGDRTGLELIRTLQQKIVSLQQEDFAETGDYESHIRVFHETTITELFSADGKIAGAFGYYRSTGGFVRFDAPAVVLATGGVGKSYQVTSNSWEYTGDGHALALRAGATLINMEFLQFHPTGMVWPPSVKGILVTESVRGDGGVLRNSEGDRFMFDYIPDVFKDQYATSEEEADRWYTDADNNRRPPELLPRDEVARAINSEVKAGRGSPHGGVFLDIASRLSAEEIQKRLPSMYHQFKELADVDITAEPMEVGPDLPLRDGRRGGRARFGDVEGAGSVRGRRGGRRHARLQPAGRQLAVGPAGVRAAGRRRGVGLRRRARRRPAGGAPRPTSPRREKRALLPFSSATEGGENPFVVQLELQKTMNDLVGIIRKADEMELALKALQDLAVRTRTVSVEGRREFNPGWHLALDLRNMLLVSLCVAKAALERQESRGGHTRDDYPAMDSDWRHVLLVAVRGSARTTSTWCARSRCRCGPELFDLFELDELKKYYTGEELGGHRADTGAEQGRDGMTPLASTSASGAATTRRVSSSTTRWR